MIFKNRVLNIYSKWNLKRFRKELLAVLKERNVLRMLQSLK